MSRTNVTYLNSMAGQACCVEYVEDASSHCRNACRSALFAPTMAHEEKQKQLEMVCDRRHGNKEQGDSVSGGIHLNLLPFIISHQGLNKFW
jgi:hypothetical protein